MGEAIGEINELPPVARPFGGQLKLSDSSPNAPLIGFIINNEPDTLRPSQLLIPGQFDKALVAL